MKPKLKPQLERLERANFCVKSDCIFPVCECMDGNIITKDQADLLLKNDIENMLRIIRIYLDDVKQVLRSRSLYMSSAQLRVYQRRKIRLQKNFHFWKKRYDML